ncbi:unnamed protein product [Musa banksii]
MCQRKPEKYHHLLTEKGVDRERSYSSELLFFFGGKACHEC